MSIMKGQGQASPQRGLPVEDNSSSAGFTTVTDDATVQLYYSNSGVRTADAGQIAGVAVEAVLARKNILNSQGKLQATSLDTSLAFTSSELTTEKPINLEILESLDDVAWSERLAGLTKDLEDGEFVVDYSQGAIYGKKASTGVTLTSTSYIASDNGGIASLVTLVLAEGDTATTTDPGVLGLYTVIDPTAAPSLTIGKLSGAHLDENGFLVMTDGGTRDVNNDSISTQPVEPLNINTTALAASLVIKGAAGTCYEIRGHNDSASPQYIQIHDSATLPIDTSVPEDVFLVAADSNFSITYPQSKAFAAGIVVANSSTIATLTLGSADCWFSAEYI